MRQLFNLRRCVLETPLVNGPTLFNTHLSAFSYGDGTVERQVSRLRELVEGKEFLLAGDLNSLTPYENAASLAKDEAALYPESNTPAAPLYDDANIVPLWRDAAWKSHDALHLFTFKPGRRPPRRRERTKNIGEKHTGGTPPGAPRDLQALDVAGAGPHDRPRVLLARRGLRGRRRTDGYLSDHQPAVFEGLLTTVRLEHHVQNVEDERVVPRHRGAPVEAINGFAGPRNPTRLWERGEPSPRRPPS